MLVLTRKQGESIRIGDDIEIVVTDINKGSARIGILAPKSMTIYRKEIYERILKENLAAAQLVQETSNLDNLNKILSQNLKSNNKGVIMRITTNAMFNSMLSNLNKNVADYQKIYEQVATEKSINNPSDDAKGLSVSTVLKSQNSAYTQYLENIEEAKNYLKGADNALGQLQDLIIQIREFAQSNAQETSTPVEMDIAAQQIDQFLEEALNIANTKVNDRYIFAGYRNDKPAYVNTARIITPYAAAENAYEGIVTSSGEYTGDSNKRI